MHPNLCLLAAAADRLAFASLVMKADIINSVSSDVISFCSSRTFEQFKETAEQLNMIGVYQSLTNTVASRGLTVSKVACRTTGPSHP